MEVSTALLRRFEDLSRDDVDYAGGKGANLGEMTAAGLPVPGGFVVGAPSYAIFCDVGGLREQDRASASSSVDVDDTAALDRAHQEVRVMVEEEPVPDELAQADPGLRTSSSRATATTPGRGALLGDRRGHRGGVLRRHERDLPQRPRRRRGRRRRAPLLVLAVRRPHRLLPRQAGLRAGRHGHRRRRPAPDPLDPRGRHVHDRPGLRATTTAS